MDRRAFGWEALMIIVGVLPIGCAIASDDARSYRYRLTAEVETPGGLKTGSSVIQVIGDEASKYALSPGLLSFRIFGEAAAIDLPNGKKLFALLRRPNGTSDNAASYAPIAYAAPNFTNDYQRQLTQWLKKRHGVAVLPPHDPREDHRSSKDGTTKVTPIGPLPVDPEPRYYPMLVTFGNLNDPTTVIAVDARHLDRTFGAGFKLKRITVEMTDLPVTRTLEWHLPWIKSFTENGGLLGGQKFNDNKRPEKNLGYLDFVREQR